MQRVVFLCGCLGYEGLDIEPFMIEFEALIEEYSLDVQGAIEAR